MSATAPRFVPTRLDVAAFAKAQAGLEGHLSWAQLPRLSQSTVAPSDGGPAVAWSAQGLWRPVTAGLPELRIRLQARGTVWQTCQRCLEPVAEALAVDRTFRFVAGEEEAERLDEDSEEDVLALGRSLDLPTLVEDELILALPLVPRHRDCPHPLPRPSSAAAEGEASRGPVEAPMHPFAVLKSLKSR